MKKRTRPFILRSFLATAAVSVSVAQCEEPTPQFSDPIKPCSSTIAAKKIQDGYWNSEFKRVNQAVAVAKGSQVIFFGDSITLRWSLARAEGKAAWEKHFAKYRPINMGNSGDITPVMLYRTTHGNLAFPEGQVPRVAVILAGTNNYVVKQSDGGKVTWDLGPETPPQEVADGIRAVAQSFRRELPSTRLIVLGILPVKNKTKWARCQETNRILADLHYPKDEVVFLDLADHFLKVDGSLKEDLFTDGTHLSPAGYEVMAQALAPRIAGLVKLGPIE